MQIIKRILIVAIISILLYSLILVLSHPDEIYYGSDETRIYGKGNATEDVRAEIVQQLQKFQDGYTHRDTSLLDPFMEELFSKDNILVLGTMPGEILKNHERVKVLVSSDWRTWGDCRFQMDNAHISTAGDVAWISTIGYVEFDMSRFLVSPLRLSAVMVKENDVWKFQHMQFQFDVDFSPILATFILLLVWLPISLASLTVVIVKRFKKSK
ncbi:MAG: nuclear transport factor 2 family protein [Candidatus Zixiibacteriota bacterium]|nr:MAG: nuclear transport factor 2 family protein [candidate division Zixibacteria bacterium]